MSPVRWWCRTLVGILLVATTCFVLFGVQPLGQGLRSKDHRTQSLELNNLRDQGDAKQLHGDNVSILLWTPFYQEWNYLRESDEGCPVSCKVTNDRSKVKDSQAIIFHCRDLNLVDLPLFRSAYQQWIFYCLESPEYSYFEGFHHMHNMFNLTMTYRQDSDVVIPYGFVHNERPPASQGGATSNQIPEVPLTTKKNIFWLVSHCSTAGHREEFVSELSKWIPVDIFGSCGQTTCKRDSANSCFQALSNQYKFVLAFENSLCRDYATEKFFKALRYNIVPVVYGGANYASIAPPNSFIDALSFPSVKHLAEHLETISRNATLYKSYLAWKKTAWVDMYSGQALCKLCQKLHSSTNVAYTYKDMYNWWVEKGHCFKWRPR